MSRDAKIIIFSLILVFSIYNKNVNEGFFDSTNDKTTTKTSNSRPKPPASTPKTKEFDIDSPDYTTIPQSGHSPYDAYFGKGIYHNTDNSIVVTAPAKTHVVFVVIDTYTGRRIRNEFIRKGETFTMTKIPYGTYDYMYLDGIGRKMY